MYNLFLFNHFCLFFPENRLSNLLSKNEEMIHLRKNKKYLLMFDDI